MPVLRGFDVWPAAAAADPSQIECCREGRPTTRRAHAKPKTPSPPTPAPEQFRALSMDQAQQMQKQMLDAHPWRGPEYDGLSAVEACLGLPRLASPRVEACKPPYVPQAQPGPCPKVRWRLKSLRRKAAARRSPAGSGGDGGYTGPQVTLPPDVRARWGAAMRDAVKAGATDPELSDEDRQAAREAAEAFRDGLDPGQQRRFDQEKSITLRQEEWRRRSAKASPGPGESPAQMQARMRAALRDLWAGKKVAIRATHHGLQGLLEDGRFKTIHETGTSGGFNDPKSRADLEEQVFGIDPDRGPLEQRPVYGYLAVNGIRRQGLDASLGQYGPVQVILKDEVRRRTTASNGDSMAKRNSVRPSPVDSPEHWSYLAPIQAPGRYDVDTEKLTSRDYVETQIHGGVGVGDIEEVVFSRHPGADLEKLLTERGVPWRIVN